MTAAKVMDIISRLPGCAGQAAVAVSVYTQVKMEDAQKLFKIPKIGVSRHLDSSTTTQMAKIMVQYGRPSRSSWKEFVRSSFGRTFMGKAIIENPITARLGEVSNWECLFVHCQKGLFLSVYVHDIKLAGRCIIQSVTADSSLRSPTGGVEGLYPTPHIYEQMTAQIMATSLTTLTTTRWSTLTLACTWSCTTLSPEHTERIS